MITKEEFAQMLNGCEYGSELTREEEVQAKQNNLVVVFGYSDDNAEFRGAIWDEIGCYNGTEISLSMAGIFVPCEDDDCRYSKYFESLCAKIEAIWDSEGYSWIYKTNIPHACFDIMDDGKKYCRGIVFELHSLPTVLNKEAQ